MKPRHTPCHLRLQSRAGTGSDPTRAVRRRTRPAPDALARFGAGLLLIMLVGLNAPVAEAALTLAVGEEPRGPRIAVADDGTGHVAWSIQNPGIHDDTLTY